MNKEDEEENWCKNHRGCLNYAGLEADLEFLVEVCKKNDIEHVRQFIKYNYPDKE